MYSLEGIFSFFKSSGKTQKRKNSRRTKYVKRRNMRKTRRQRGGWGGMPPVQPPVNQVTP